jgi:hypothetical protein
LGNQLILLIHPGYQRNKYEDVAVAILELIDGYKKAFGVEPLIMLENRTTIHLKEQGH